MPRYIATPYQDQNVSIDDSARRFAVLDSNSDVHVFELTPEGRWLERRNSVEAYEQIGPHAQGLEARPAAQAEEIDTHAEEDRLRERLHLAEEQVADLQSKLQQSENTSQVLEYRSIATLNRCFIPMLIDQLHFEEEGIYTHSVPLIEMANVVNDVANDLLAVPTQEYKSLLIQEVGKALKSKGYEVD